AETTGRGVDTTTPGDDAQPPTSRPPGKAALLPSLPFIPCGSTPLVPFVLGFPATIEASTAMTGLTFFSIGSLRSRWSPAPWWRAGLETFAIGISAAIIAYAVGVLLGNAIH